MARSPCTQAKINNPAVQRTKIASSMHARDARVVSTYLGRSKRSIGRLTSSDLLVCNNCNLTVAVKSSVASRRRCNYRGGMLVESVGYSKV